MPYAVITFATGNIRRMDRMSFRLSPPPPMRTFVTSRAIGSREALSISKIIVGTAMIEVT